MYRLRSDSSPPRRSSYGSVASYRPAPSDSASDGYDAGGLADEVEDLHNSMNEEERESIVHIKDAYDSTGEGMLFKLDMTSSFKHVFHAFKAASCRTCRPASGMRFKADARKLEDADTPATIVRSRVTMKASNETDCDQPNLKHAQTLTIKVYSNGPGLNCAACKVNGYPSTNCRYLDGNVTQLHNVQEPSGRLIRLLFRDPNQVITQIPVNSSNQLRHAMEDYARRIDLNRGTLHFSFEDEKIAVDDTPEEMGMKNNSVIDVHVHSLGA